MCFRIYFDSQPNDWELCNLDLKLANFKTHTFVDVGVFWVTVMAENSVGTWNATVPEPMIVQHPVTGFSLECGKAVNNKL